METSRDSAGTFLTATVVMVGDPIPSPPFDRTQRFRTISAHSASTVRAGEKSSVRPSTNIRKSTTRFPTSHRWTGRVRCP